MKTLKNENTPTENRSTASGITIHCAFDALEDVASLVANPRNPNKHGDKQVALLAKIIRHQGWRAPIVVSNRSGFIVTGHGRLEAAKLLNVEKVPVNRQDFATEADEWAHLIADNRIAELAETDDAELMSLIKELDGKIEIDLTGFTDIEEISGASEGMDPTKTPAERFEAREANSIRTLLLVYDYEQYAEILRMLNDIAAHIGTETHNDTIDRCVKDAHANIGNKKEED